MSGSGGRKRVEREEEYVNPYSSIDAVDDSLALNLFSKRLKIEDQATTGTSHRWTLSLENLAFDQATRGNNHDQTDEEDASDWASACGGGNSENDGIAGDVMMEECQPIPALQLSRSYAMENREVEDVHDADFHYVNPILNQLHKEKLQRLATKSLSSVETTVSRLHVNGMTIDDMMEEDTTPIVNGSSSSSSSISRYNQQDNPDDDDNDSNKNEVDLVNTRQLIPYVPPENLLQTMHFRRQLRFQLDYENRRRLEAEQDNQVITYSSLSLVNGIPPITDMALTWAAQSALSRASSTHSLHQLDRTYNGSSSPSSFSSSALINNNDSAGNITILANIPRSRSNAGHQLLLENSHTNNQSRYYSNNHEEPPMNHSYHTDGGSRIGDENDTDEGNMDVDDDFF